MLKKFLFFVVLFFQCFTIFGVNYNDFEHLELQYQNTISYDISLDSKYSIEDLTITDYLYPQESNFLTITEREFSIPSVTEKKENGNTILEYETSKYTTLGTNTFQTLTSFTSNYYFPKIYNKVDYPITSSEPSEFLSFIGLIDISPEIKQKASELASGETDTFLIAAKIAKWIREDIEYDLSTVTENPNQKSSQVFISKKGVCKEITNLYVSMMRSLGIPARVVTGFAYTNSQEVIDFVGSPWGGHAWAEVKIGNTWVPFDLTYNQYGFVDATHIPTYKDKEIKVQSISLSGKGYGFSIIDHSLQSNQKFVVTQFSENHSAKKFFDISITGPNELGFGSFGYLHVKIKNTQSYYQVAFVQLSKTPEISLISEQKKMVILKPFEEKEIIFKYKIPENLDPKYIYTFPFTLYTETQKETFEVKVEKSFQTIIEKELPIEKKEDKAYSSNSLPISCSYEVHSNKNSIFCSVKNNNNFEIYSMRLCVESECETSSLTINEEKTFSFSSPSFSPTLTYAYLDKKGEIQIDIAKPVQEVTLLPLKQRLRITSSKQTIEQEYLTSITINNQETVTLQNTTMELALKPGNYNISIQTKHPNTHEVLIENTQTIIITDYTLWEKIVRLFKHLF
jgi:transglutaminase-like putative cysteine protease